MKLKAFIVFVYASTLIACKKQEAREFAESYKPIAGEVNFFKGGDLNAYWQTKNGDLPPDLKRVGNFSFANERGETITAKDLAGKFTIVGFFFSRCAGICPMVTANIKRISQKITDQRDALFLSISIDPDNDKMAQLKEFKSRFESGQANWHFLTGNKEEIYAMARSVFNADVVVRTRPQGDNDFIHTENVYLIDQNLYLRGIYRAKGMGDIDRLILDLTTLRGAKAS